MNSDQQTASKKSTGVTAPYFDREVGWLRTDTQRVRWLLRAGFAVLILYLVIVGALGTGPINVFHNDALMLLDDGWRVLNGQVPHRDFFTPLGPVEFWLVGAGMLLAKGGAQGIAISIAIFGFVIGVWSWFLVRLRLLPLFGLMITAWLVLTAASPTPLGFEPRFLSCAMIYNRQGYALLGIILVECAFAQKNRFWGGFSSGAALILLMFLKLNFFGIGVIILLTSTPLKRVEFVRMWGVLAGAGGILLGVLLYPRFSLSAFVTDMSFVSAARKSSLNLGGILHGAGTCAKSGIVWLVVAMTIVILLSESSKERWRRPTITLVALSCIVLASGPLFLQTNSLENRCQLASLWSIILIERVSAIHLRTEQKLITILLIALGLGGVATTLGPEFVSALNVVRFHSAAVMATAARVDAPGMDKVRFYDSTSFYEGEKKTGDGDGAFYANCINDGLSLVKQTNPGESILSLGFHNPYSYLLRRKPAQGGSSYLYIGNSITQSHMPPVDWVFDHADLMILPDYEGNHHASDQFIQNYYRTYLLQNFHFVARSQCWLLYRRNK